MEKKFFYGILCLLVLHCNAQEYVDLGLPSGTLWKSENESFHTYTFAEAMSTFGDQMPSKEQMEELINLCSWDWTFDTNNMCINIKMIGPNGKFILLPIYKNKVYGIYAALYWTSTSSGWYYVSDSDTKWGLHCYYYPDEDVVKVKIDSGWVLGYKNNMKLEYIRLVKTDEGKHHDLIEDN